MYRTAKAICAATLTTALSLSVACEQRDAPEKLFDGSLYGVADSISINELLDQTWTRGDLTLYLFSETHHRNAPTPQKVEALMQHRRIDVVALEGLEGEVTPQTIQQINEDWAYLDALIELSKDPEAYTLDLQFGPYPLVYAGPEIYVGTHPDRPFLGYSPGSVIALALHGKLPLYGYEDMDLYQRSLGPEIHNNLSMLQDRLAFYAKHCIAYPAPESVMADYGFVLAMIDDFRHEIEQKHPFISDQDSSQDSANRDFPPELNDTRELKQRSELALEKTIDYMERNGYASAAFVMGRTHFPTLKSWLRTHNFEPGPYSS
ncbi:hypothetical protein HYW21_06390 [Candidatus Woesearchaeota archaeon]|nr:hypothetical protein [Candidatus Woesearchaeota archaeon]